MASSNQRMTKDQRREAAREKARQMREQELKREKRNRLFVQLGVVVGVLAVIALVVVVALTSIRPAGPSPKNMASDGIRIEQNLQAVPTPARDADVEPILHQASTDKIDITIYLDYFCIHCRNFEIANGPFLKSLLLDEIATVEFRPIDILTANSGGTRYSSRAANAAACVAEYSPNNFFDYNTLLFSQSPDASGRANWRGFTDDEMIDLARRAGVSNFANVESCINSEQFRSWVEGSKQYLRDLMNAREPFPGGSQPEEGLGTPMVYANGIRYTGDTANTIPFVEFIRQIEAQQIEQNGVSEGTQEGSSGN